MSRRHSGAAPMTPVRRVLSSHTILVIDKSGSMRNKDVATTSGFVASRNDSLFDILLNQFLPHQESLGENGPDDVYSLVTFNDVPLVQFKHKTMSETKALLPAVRVSGARSHGYYGTALDTLRCLLVESTSLTAAATMVLFLSDGKPSDLLPRGPLAPLQKHIANLVGMTKAAVAPILDSAVEGKTIFTFHAMGFGPAEEFAVLKAMATSLPHGLGVFHHAGLDVRSLKKVIGEFSSSVTESRLSSKQIGPARPLREVKIDRNLLSYTLNKTYDAQVWDPPTDVDSTDWNLRGDFRIDMCDTAFGAGGERNAFMMKFLTGDEETQDATWVAKEDKREASDAEETKFHKQKLVAQKYSKRAAVIFNREILEIANFDANFRCRELAPQLSFPSSYLLKTKGPDKRFLFVEKYIPGKLTKWNDNSGFVRSSKTAAFDAIFEEDEEEEDDEDNSGGGVGGLFGVDDVPQAFSHWSHVNSRRCFDESFLICDLQGFYNAKSRSYQLIDPVIHSGLGETTYARTDHGPKGIATFYSTHCCSNLCRRLGLPAVLPSRESVAMPDSASIPTSAIPINKTKHLQMRQSERGIETKELQRAVKHGEKEVVRDGKIKHTHAGVSYITDRLGAMGITGFKQQTGQVWTPHFLDGRR